MLPHKLPRPDEGHPVDRSLRSVLTPEPALAERVRRCALAPAAGGSGRGVRGTGAFLLSAALLLVMAGLFLFFPGRNSPSEPAPAVRAIELRTAEPAPFLLNNAGGVVTMVAPDGRIRALVAGG